MNIYEFANEIKTRKDFEKFLRLLIDDYRNNKDSWENDRLDFYLEGLYGYNYEAEEEEPSWKLFAEILLAAKVYE